ncbi:MAG: helix-turn-helix transcriptional regulator [Nocardioidaceae bacterium]
MRRVTSIDAAVSRTANRSATRIRVRRDGLEHVDISHSSGTVIQLARDQLLLSDDALERVCSGKVRWSAWQHTCLTGVAHLLGTDSRGKANTISVADHDDHLLVTINLVLAAVLNDTVRMLRSPESRSLPAQRRHAVERYIHEHLLDPSLGPDVVADHLGLSLRQLDRCFPSRHGVTGVLRRARLDHAELLLRDPDLLTIPISQIGEHCLFRSPARFSKAFRATKGMTPREARSQADKRS